MAARSTQGMMRSTWRVIDSLIALRFYKQKTQACQNDDCALIQKGHFDQNNKRQGSAGALLFWRPFPRLFHFLFHFLFHVFYPLRSEKRTRLKSYEYAYGVRRYYRAFIKNAGMFWVN